MVLTGKDVIQGEILVIVPNDYVVFTTSEGRDRYNLQYYRIITKEVSEVSPKVLTST